MRLPVGYRDYMTTLGEGLYSGHVRVYPPARIISELPEFQQQISQVASWAGCADGDGNGPIPDQMVLLGDTIDGDYIMCERGSATPHLYLLSRHSPHMHRIGTTLDAALEWIITAGKLLPLGQWEVLTPSEEWRVQKVRYFEPWSGRAGTLYTFHGNKDLSYRDIRAFLQSTAISGVSETFLRLVRSGSRVP